MAYRTREFSRCLTSNQRNISRITDLKDQARRRLVLPVGLPSLHPTISAWQEPPHPKVATMQSPELPQETDIAVIGSGITGCSVAYALLHDSSAEATGLHVTVIEARSAVSGATGRNGGHLISDSDSLFGHHVETLGKDQATEILHFSEANIARLKEIVAELDPVVREAVEFRTLEAVAGLGKDMLEDSKLNKTLIEKVIVTRKLESRVISKEETMTVSVLESLALVHKLIHAQKYLLNNVDGGALQAGAAALWPYRLFTAIFGSLLQNFPERFSLETNTPVRGISYNATEPYPYSLETSRGIIHAKKIIHCTNGYSAYLLPSLVGKLWPLRGTMSRQSPGPSFPNMGHDVSWSHVVKSTYDIETGNLSAGLHYAQQNPYTGDIWIGGEVQRIDDLLTDDDSKVANTAQNNILSVLPRLFREIEPIGQSQVWSGIMGFTSDGLPFVGRLTPHMTGRSGYGEWIAAGFNGHGMDKAWLTGETIAKMALGGEISQGFPRAYLCDDGRFDRMSAESSAEALASKF